MEINKDKLVIVEHPLIKQKLTVLRDKNSNTLTFRNAVTEITRLLSYEAFKKIELNPIEIETPIAKAIGYNIKNNINIYPILRAGQGMVEGVTSLVPTAKIGHIGLYRDEKTLKPVKYLFKTPKVTENSFNIIVDPILATGGSLIEAIRILKEVNIKNILVIAILGAEIAIKNIQEIYPEITIYVAAIDKELNSDGYIVPGLGDAGDRIFGTK